MPLTPLIPAVKRTSGVDFNKALSKALTKQPGAEELDFTPDLNALTKMRGDCNMGGAAALTNLQTYFFTLCQIENRVDWSSPLAIANLSFTWYDSYKEVKTFERTSKTSSPSVQLEKAAIGFNVAATLSELAEGCSKVGDEANIVQAARNYQQAAGWFMFVRDNLIGHIIEKCTPDLTRESLDIMVHLMLGNAQRCVLERGKGNNSSTALLAKLASGASSHFRSAASLLAGPNITKEVAPKWLAACQISAEMLNAEAHVFMAQVLRKEMETGKGLGHMKHALRAIQFADETAKKEYPERRSAVQALAAIVQAEQDQSSTDNQKCYKQTVVDAPAMVEGVQPVKAVPLPDISEFPQASALLQGLVPVGVAKAVSSYKEAAADAVKDIMESTRAATEAAKQTMNELNLPGALEANDQGTDGLPPRLRERVLDIQRQQGGVEAMWSLHRQGQDMSKVSKGLLGEVSRLLDDEEANDSSLRQQFGEQWSRSPSSSINSSLRRDVTKYEQKLAQAGAADETVSTKLKEKETSLRKLEVPLDSFETTMRGAVAQQSQATEGFAQVLRGEIARLDALFDVREDLESQLQKQSETADISEAMFKAPAGTPPDEVVSQVLAQFEPLKAQLNENIMAQGGVLEAIRRANVDWSGSRTSSEAGKAREDLIQELDGAVNAFGEIMNNFREGVEFYSNVQDHIERLRRNVTDFVSARQIEKQDLMEHVTRALGNTNVSGGATNNSMMPTPSATPSAPGGGAGDGFGAPFGQQQQQQQPYGAPPPGYNPAATGAIPPVYHAAPGYAAPPYGYQQQQPQGTMQQHPQSGFQPQPYNPNAPAGYGNPAHYMPPNYTQQPPPQ